MPSDRKVARGDQLAALSVITDAVVGYKHPNDVEGWFRRRTDIEDRIRQAKLGAALRHLPSGDSDVNAVWMWAALLAGEPVGSGAAPIRVGRPDAATTEDHQPTTR